MDCLIKDKKEIQENICILQAFENNINRLKQYRPILDFKLEYSDLSFAFYMLSYSENQLPVNFKKISRMA